jgi:hypothetical protein
MATWTPDPTFYPSPRMAMQAPAEKLGYVAILNVARVKPDVPKAGDELHQPKRNTSFAPTSKERNINTPAPAYRRAGYGLPRLPGPPHTCAGG